MGIENNNLSVPPPSGSEKSNQSAGGVILNIPLDCVIDISHTYNASLDDPTEYCLMVIQVKERGSMKFEWAVSGWHTDDLRVDNLNKKLSNNKIIIIAADQILLNSGSGKEAANKFWSTMSMKALPKQEYAPDTEYYTKDVKGVTGKIQVAKGIVKIVDLS